MALVGRKNERQLSVIFMLVTWMICMLQVLPELYYLLNVGIVSLLLIYYLINYQFRGSKRIIYIGLFMLLEVLVSADVSRVSILVMYFFLNVESFYKERTVKRYIKIQVWAFFLILLMYLVFGFNREYDRLSWDFVALRHFNEYALGFTNPNRCMLYAFCLSCILLLRTERKRDYFLVLLGNLVLYRLTQSRTFFYVLVMIVVVLLLLKMKRAEHRRGLLTRMVPWVFWGLFALSVLLPLFFSDTILNEIFTRRLAHNKEFLQEGLSLFGNAALEDATFDSSYLHMLLTKGVLFIAVYVQLLLSRCRRAVMSNKQAVVLCAVFFCCFMEVLFQECGILFLIGYAIHAPVEKEMVYAG